ncbi:MAG: hypothetical protein P8N02_15590 [Actinomycetota bacterium]|nr:hypothetical protein [Actinomycetota bacterium]
MKLGEDRASGQTEASLATSAQAVEVVVDVTVPLIGPATGLRNADPAVAAAAQASAGVGPSSAGATPVASRTPVPAGAAPTTAATPTAAPASPTTQAPTTTQAPEVVATEYRYYSFSGVASTIIVAIHGGSSLQFWSATAEPGWVYNVEKASGSEITVEFFRPADGDEGQFTAKLEEGEVKIEKDS